MIHPKVHATFVFTLCLRCCIFRMDARCPHVTWSWTRLCLHRLIILALPTHDVNALRQRTFGSLLQSYYHRVFTVLINCHVVSDVWRLPIISGDATTLSLILYFSENSQTADVTLRRRTPMIASSWSTFTCRSQLHGAYSYRLIGIRFYVFFLEGLHTTIRIGQ